MVGPLQAVRVGPLQAVRITLSAAAVVRRLPLIVSENGISAVEPGEPRPKPSADYQRFSEVWAESQRLIESVVPEKSGRAIEAVDERIYDVGRKPR